jgi:glycerol dehydrogenase-like iron-containing ADH family enzyme
MVSKYANVRDLKRIREFLKEINMPINKTDLGKATMTSDKINSAINFMLREGWIKEKRDCSMKLYYSVETEWANSIFNSDDKNTLK